MNRTTEILIVFITLLQAPKKDPKKDPNAKVFEGQTGAEVQKTFDALFSQGWRYKRIRGYEVDGQARFDSEWHRPPKPQEMQCFHGIDRDMYAAHSAKLRKAGFVEVLKSVWKVNGSELFWTIWEKK